MNKYQAILAFKKKCDSKHLTMDGQLSALVSARLPVSMIAEMMSDTHDSGKFPRQLRTKKNDYLAIGATGTDLVALMADGITLKRIKKI